MADILGNNYIIVIGFILLVILLILYTIIMWMTGRIKSLLKLSDDEEESNSTSEEIEDETDWKAAYREQNDRYTALSDRVKAIEQFLGQENLLNFQNVLAHDALQYSSVEPNVAFAFHQTCNGKVERMLDGCMALGTTPPVNTCNSTYTDVLSKVNTDFQPRSQLGPSGACAETFQPSQGAEHAPQGALYPATSIALEPTRESLGLNRVSPIPGLTNIWNAGTSQHQRPSNPVNAFVASDPVFSVSANFGDVVDKLPGTQFATVKSAINPVAENNVSNSGCRQILHNGLKYEEAATNFAGIMQHERNMQVLNDAKMNTRAFSQNRKNGDMS